MASAPQHPIPRRVVLLGAAGTALLAACGGAGTDDSDADRPAGTDGDASGAGHDALSLVAMFNAGGPFLVSGQPQRAPFTIGDERGLEHGAAVPDQIDLRLVRAEDDTEVVAPTTVAARREGVHTAYFPYLFEVADAGTYLVRATLEGQELSAAITVVHPDEVTYPLVGAALPVVATPTVDDARGVDPICTAEPPCDRHAESLDAILGAGRPVAVLVATPKFCQTSLCGPTLELLLEAAAAHPDLDVVHVEVYESGAGVEEGAPVVAPAVAGLGLDFEPVLLVADEKGTVVSVLASAMDRSEIAEALALVAR